VPFIINRSVIVGIESYFITLLDTYVRWVVLAPAVLFRSWSGLKHLAAIITARSSPATSLLELLPRRSCRTRIRGSATSCAMPRSVFSHPAAILLAICRIALTFVQTSQSSKQSVHWKQVPSGMEPRNGARDHRSNGWIGNMSARSLSTPV